MTRHLVTTLLLVPLVLPAAAGEVTLEPGSFEKVLRFDATLLPAEPVPFAIDPESWESFAIKELLPHGAMVKKGQAIAVLDTEGLDRKIKDEAEAARLRKMTLANARRDLTNLEIVTPRRLEVSERTHKRAQEDLEYFREVSREQKVKSAHRMVERAERQLEYQQEELTQLLAMYREDDLTEETEEIILKRQRNSVADATDYLERSVQARDFALKTEIPREAQDLTLAAKDAELTWISSRETLPRALEMKRIEVAKLVEADKRADETLAELKADRKLMELKSPAKGLLYYGEIADGVWNVGQTAKFMKTGGSLPFKTVFATVIPEGGAMQVHGKVDESQLPGLKPGLKGTFAPKMAPRQRLGVQVEEVASHPDLAGKYAVVFSLAGAAPDLIPGMTGRLSVVTSQAEGVLTVPADAVHERGNGELYVKVKGEGDASEERAVRLGVEAEGRIVVEEGLAAGEVVITKGETKE